MGSTCRRSIKLHPRCSCSRRAGLTPLPTRETFLEDAESAENTSIEMIPLAVPLENGAPSETPAGAGLSNGVLDVEAGLNRLASEGEAVEDKDGSAGGNGAHQPDEDKPSPTGGAKPSNGLLESVGQQGGGGCGQRGGVQWRTGEQAEGKELEIISGEDGRMAHSHGFLRRECVVPMKLLAEPKVRAILFVYGVFSVSERSTPSGWRSAQLGDVFVCLALTAATPVPLFLMRSRFVCSFPSRAVAWRTYHTPIRSSDFIGWLRNLIGWLISVRHPIGLSNQNYVVTG